MFNNLIQPHQGGTARRKRNLRLSRVNTCLHCSKQYYPSHRRQTCCSLACSQKLSAQKKGKITGILDRHKCATCHAVIGMSGALSGLLVGLDKSTICIFRKQSGLKTLTRLEARQSNPRLRMQRQHAWQLRAWEDEWRDVVDNYWTRCTSVVIAKMGDPEMRKLTNGGVAYHLNSIACKERSRINSRATWNRNKGNTEWRNKRKACNLAWATKHKHKLAENRRQWITNNPEKVKKAMADARERRRQWIIENPEKWKKARADQRRRPEVKVRHNIRRRMRDILGSNSDTFAESVGCTPRQLKIYLEAQFTKQMSWENYGTYWHIDHIHPLASFDLTDTNQRRIACNLNNLRPLSAKENMQKGDRITVPQLHLCFTA